MTRAELLDSAKGLLLITGIAGLPAIITAFFDAPHLGVVLLTGMLASGAVLTGIAGLYMGLRGVLRPAEWRPGRKDWEPRTLDLRPHGDWLRRRVERELPEAVVHKVRAEALEVPEEREPVSMWTGFFGGHDDWVDLYRLTAEVEAGERALQLSVHVGRSVDDPSPSRGRVLVQAVCRVSPSTQPPAWTQDRNIITLIAHLVRGRHPIVIPGPGFDVVHGQAKLDTLSTPRGIWDFVGLKEFLEAVRLIEATEASAEGAPRPPPTGRC